MKLKRPFSLSEWLGTPKVVRRYIEAQEQINAQLVVKIDQLENRLNQNSQNSNKPPSSEGPFKQPKKKVDKKKRKRGTQKGHRGNRQQLLKPTRIVKIVRS